MSNEKQDNSPLPISYNSDYKKFIDEYFKNYTTEEFKKLYEAAPIMSIPSKEEELKLSTADELKMEMKVFEEKDKVNLVKYDIFGHTCFGPCSVNDAALSKIDVGCDSLSKEEKTIDLFPKLKRYHILDLDENI